MTGLNKTVGMRMSVSVWVYICVYIYIYTGCPGGNVPDFRRLFLKLKYADLTKNTYIRSWLWRKW